MLELKEALDLYFEKVESVTNEDDIIEIRENIAKGVMYEDYDVFMEAVKIDEGTVVRFYQHLFKVIVQSHLIREKAPSWLNNSLMNASVDLAKAGYLKNDKRGNPVLNQNFVNAYNLIVDADLNKAKRKIINEINKSNRLSTDMKNIDKKKLEDFYKNIPDYIKHVDTFVTNYDSIVAYIKDNTKGSEYEDDVNEMIDTYFRKDEYNRRLKKKG